MKQKSYILKSLVCIVTLTLIGSRMPASAKGDDFQPKFSLNIPNEEKTKIRTEHGSAYIDFATGKSEIVPGFRDNAQELRKIRATLDMVRNDRDVEIKTLQIIGYASPEGDESRNRALSAARTRSLAEYIRDNFSLPYSTAINSLAGGEDWQTLRKLLKAGDFSNKYAILAIIDDDDLTLDEKQALIADEYPVEYRQMLKEIFPMLRRSDYEIEYAVRDFNSLDDIKRILAENPKKLSLYEMYRYANTLKPSTDSFYDIIFSAVDLFPDNEHANLNAGAAAIARKSYDKARKYLGKAGNSGYANFNRGVLYAREGDYSKAYEYFRQAPDVDGSSDYMLQTQRYASNASGKYNNNSSDNKTNNYSFTPSKNTLDDWNLAVGVGISNFTGEFLRTRITTQNLTGDHHGWKCTATFAIGKELIFDSYRKNRIACNIGVGTGFGNAQWMWNMFNLAWGTSPLYSKPVSELSSDFEIYFGKDKRLGVFGGIGVVFKATNEGGGKNSKAPNHDRLSFSVGVSYKFLQKKAK